MPTCNENFYASSKISFPPTTNETNLYPLDSSCCNRDQQKSTMGMTGPLGYCIDQSTNQYQTHCQSSQQVFQGQGHYNSKYNVRPHSRSCQISLCKTLLSSKVMAPSFPKFVAALVLSMWYNKPFNLVSKIVLRQFTLFISEILNVTKLPFSVIILALHYIHRIRSRCRGLSGKPGSEYRLFICTLNLAMKFLIDNTFSNKTWSKLSHIPLIEINFAEMEFLSQLHYDLHVDPDEFFSWLLLVDSSFHTFKRLEMQTARLEVETHVKNRQCISPPLSPTSPTITFPYR